MTAQHPVELRPLEQSQPGRGCGKDGQFEGCMTVSLGVHSHRGRMFTHAVSCIAGMGRAGVDACAVCVAATMSCAPQQLL